MREVRKSSRIHNKKYLIDNNDFLEVILMCSGPGFSLINVGDEEHILAKEYICLDCGSAFKGMGVLPSCPSCKSRNVKRAKKHSA